MDWLELLRWAAASVTVIGLLGTGVLALLAWLLNHPKD